ncbi:hypothetical protein [Candidatus Enterovibrio altilux]|nr:hypothetical protein [Candidatus Enterovibrio luxaltus]
MLPNFFKQTPPEETRKYQVIMLTAPDNVTKPSVLNEQFHLPY